MLELTLLLLALRIAQKLDWLASLRLRGVKDRLVILLVHAKNQTTGATLLVIYIRRANWHLLVSPSRLPLLHHEKQHRLQGLR
jgi:hypothetical protein